MARRSLHALVALIVLLGATTFAPAAHASPGYIRLVTYYEGCGSSAYAVGWATRDCNGNWTYTGTQAGHWKEVEDVGCETSDDIINYYQLCNGVWHHEDAIAECTCD